MPTQSLKPTLACLVAFLLGTCAVLLTAQSGEPQAVTFNQVLDYLKLEVKEEKILKLVQESPTVFTLGSDQMQQLQAAGASERLLMAMKKSGAAKVSEQTSDIRDFVLILDCSGSMKDEAERGVTKFEAAQKAAVTLIRSIPEKRQLAFIVYGHDLTKRCASIEMLRELSPLDENGKDDLAQMIAELKPCADTPIAASLRIAGQVLQSTSDLAKVVLITDGMESCHGDPAAEAAKLAGMPHLKGGVDVIGFGLKREEMAAVETIARAGKGEFYNADSVARLRESVEKVGAAMKKSKLNETDETGLSNLDRLLVKQLADKDVNVRLKAARSLGERKVKGALPGLATLVSNETWDYGASVGVLGSNSDTDGSKDEALKAMLNIDRKAAEKALIAGLSSRHAYAAAWAAFHLGENRMTSASPELAKVIASDRWELANGGIMGHKTFLLDAQKVIALSVLKKLDRQAAEDALILAAESKTHQVREWATEMLTKVAEEGK